MQIGLELIKYSILIVRIIAVHVRIVAVQFSC